MEIEGGCDAGMKTIATVQVDLERTFLGTRSRLTDELRGAAILRRTVERLRSVEGLQAIYVLSPADQCTRCERLLEGTAAVIRGYDAPPPNWASLVQTARKWSLDGWRGGIGGTTSFDEFTDSRLIAGLLDTAHADVVLSVPPAAPLFDAGLAQKMIESRKVNEDEARLIFTQAPPGVAGVLLDAKLIRELAERSVPIGAAFSYKPDAPRKDLIFESCCVDIPTPLRFGVGRLIADTRRSTERISDLLDDHQAPSLEEIGEWLIRRDDTHVEALPREVEIELTTDDPYPGALLRPHVDGAEARGPIDIKLVGKLFDELIQYDDTLVVLGGFGDPLLHPRLLQILEMLRPTDPSADRVYGLAIRTSAATLTEETCEALVRHRVDVLNPMLDAWTPALYTQLQCPTGNGGADLDRVLAMLDKLSTFRKKETSVAPIVVPQMCKARENVHELDEFYDGWLQRSGTVNVVGYSHYSKQQPQRGVINMAPSSRTPCRRIRTRCTILADGSVALCDQDYRGSRVVGDLKQESLGAIWNSSKLRAVRSAHQAGQFDVNPLCANCDEWHRP